MSTAETAIQGQLEQAMSQSEQIIPDSVVPMSETQPLPKATAVQLLEQEGTALKGLYSPSSGEMASSMAGYKNAIDSVTWARNLSMTFSSFTLELAAFIDSNTVADVSFTAQTTTAMPSDQPLISPVHGKLKISRKTGLDRRL